VRSKAFIVSILILPAVILTMSFAQTQLAGRVDTRPRRFAVVDGSGRFWDVIDTKARERNAHLGELDGKRVARAAFEPTRAATDRPLEQLRVELSERVRKEELFAFVEIPDEPDREPLRYYSDHPAYTDLRDWLMRTVEQSIRDRRYAAARLDPALVDALQRSVVADTLGLWTRDADGRIHAAERQDVVRAVIVPMVPMFLLFFFVVISVPQLMNSVLTEKMSRISEVLLGSVSPTELMAGKLFGSVAVSLLLGLCYLGGGLVVAARMGYASSVPPALVAWFLVFLVLAMMLYGAAAMAIGAACSDVKDAQNLMLPVMLPLMLPMFAASVIIESPSSPLAVGMSLFPPATPLTMLLRVGLHPAPPVWQVALAAALTLVTTAVCVWAAGRIFRLGLLLHGKSPGLGQMVRWIFTR
jgi:ABC-2 type transport system permease protein